VSLFAEFSGADILKEKQPGNEKMLLESSPLTYSKPEPNLEGEIHPKWGRFVASHFFLS
jgi:hypothetical protein